MQREDKSLEKCWDRRDIKVKGEQGVSFEDKDGVLYSYKHLHVNGGSPIRQVIIPTPFRRQLMELAHESQCQKNHWQDPESILLAGYSR